MPYGELKINGKDAYTEYHLSMSDGGKAELMTPPASKERAFNSSRLRHGKEVCGTLERVDSRELSLPMHITARTSEEGLAYYYEFCNLLKNGAVNIEISSLPGVLFKCLYKSCSNFTEFRNQIMKFTLKVEEPNPDDRSL